MLNPQKAKTTSMRELLLWCRPEELFTGSADLVFAVRFRVLDDFHEFGEVADSLAGGVELEFFGFESETLFFKFELLGKAISF